MNIALLLDLIATMAPDRVLLGDMTAAALRNAVQRRAAAIGNAAARSGYRRVAYLGTMSSEFALTLLASAWAGLPFAPLNYRLRRDEIADQLDRIAPAVLFADAELTEKIATEWREHILARADAEDADVPYADAPDETAVLLFTSGTTAKPKAAVLRHDNLVAYVTSTTEVASADPAEAALIAVPPYHIAGVANTLTNMYVGRRTVHLPNFDPLRWLEIVRAEHVTHALVVPTMLVRIVDALAARPDLAPATLRTLSYGGGPIARGTIERALELLPDTVGLVNAYGLTETTSTVAVLTPQDHRDAWTSTEPAVRARLGSIGRPLDPSALRIVDADGAEAAPGAIGEIAVAGAQVSGAYLDHPSALDARGWLRTRDLAYRDEAGYIFLVGRADDMIIRGGENISPLEIEDVLRGHPAIRDAAVVGVPDEQWGQRVVAAVTLNENAAFVEADVIAHVRARLGSHKCPERVVVVAQLPHTDTGKVVRRALVAPLGAALRGST